MKACAGTPDSWVWMAGLAGVIIGLFIAAVLRNVEQIRRGRG